MPKATATPLPVAPQVLATGHWLANPQVTVRTSLGNIVFELYPNAAPVTAANWLAYVGTGFYDDLLFHRVIPGFVVQGGGYTSGVNYKNPTFAPIQLESDNDLSNERGTLAMARTSAADSATSQFFINLVDNVSLDYVSDASPGYAVFGRVASGLSVVDAIAAVPTLNDVPVTDVKILSTEQSKQGVVHSTTGEILLGILASEVVWTGEPELGWQYSLDGGAHWTTGRDGSFTAPAGAYEAGSILVRYRDAAGQVSAASDTGGNVVVDARQIICGNGGADRMTGSSANDPMYGLGGADTLDGAGGNDTLTAGSGSDTLIGGSGADTLDGGSGADRMSGGTASDTYLVQHSGDVVIEQIDEGTDLVKSSADHTLAANVEKLTLTGSADLDGAGNSAANTIVGNSGDNLIRGSGGNDTLTGGAGDDVFRFSSALSGSGNVDRILDFDGADDTLELENSVFLKLTATGVLQAANFRASSSGNASDGNDHVLYETDTGKLFYDADGSGAAAKVLIATLADAPALTASDLFVT